MTHKRDYWVILLYWHISFVLKWLWTKQDAFAPTIITATMGRVWLIQGADSGGAVSLVENWWRVKMNKLGTQNAKSVHWSEGIEGAELKTVLCSRGWRPLCFLSVWCCGLGCLLEFEICISGFDVCLPFSFSSVYPFLITMLGDAVCHFPHSLSYFSSTCNAKLYEWWHK